MKQTVDSREKTVSVAHRAVTAALVSWLCVAPVCMAAQEAAQNVAQGVASNGQGGFKLSVSTNIVLTNVVVRDKKTGALVTGLKQSDFTIVEDKKPQTLISFDYQNVNDAAVLQEKTTTGKASIADLLENNFAASPGQLKDHRLIVIFFDLSSMQDEDIDRAVDAATDYVKNKMQPADLVAMVSMSTGLSMDQDFTSNKDALLRVLKKYNGDDDTGFANGGTTGSTDGTSDDTNAFAADDSEYNSLNTDRELLAIRSISKSLERVDQKKSMLYFSGGLTKNGIENQASLRAATNEAAKANMAIYSVDTRGLQALPPGGDASQGSLRGNSAYSGKAVTAQFSANYSSQETLSTLSTDTGGKAFFDSNDFAPAFQQVQHDTEAYYILGFRSTDQKRDGGYRHLTIKVNRNDVKLEYRPGYYAPSDFLHQKTEDRELALTEQMRSDSPATDVSLYLQALYFMENENSFYIPVSLVIPGSQIPFTTKNNADKASIDVLGQVKNAQGITVGTVRDTVKLNLDASQQVERRNIQYSTAFTLAPGRYHLKFVVRENQTGNMGSFETDITVPDMKKVALKMSSVVLASQRTPDATRPVKGGVPTSDNLLVRDGLLWVPSVTHVFRADQHLYFLYEVYDAAKAKGASAEAASPGLERRLGGPVRVLTSIEFFKGGTKVYETQQVTATTINVPGRDAVAFQFDVPASGLKAGTYVCQINVIDDAGGDFSFPRMAVRVLAAPAAPVAAAAKP
jgi:VWFA-related protein